jgi:phytoene dehydrogenase-like protein
MTDEERYDIVIIGAGHNGTAAAAYLAKCGLSVCLLEERPEGGGAQENNEPIAGVRISPHAIANCAGAAPGWEQLELWKYGFRMQWPPTTMYQGKPPPYVMTTDGWMRITEKDFRGWTKLSGAQAQPPFTKDLARAIFWCPPHPPEIESTAENVPFMQVYKEKQPDVWTEELLEMTMFDLLDEYLESEPLKVYAAYLAALEVAHGHFQGMAIPAFGGVVAFGYFDRTAGPRGNMHGYYHAILRCAIAHGAIVRTCCPVDEIIVSNGRAVGVRLRDNAACTEKKIWANKAVISATDIKQTFLKFIGPRHLDAGFIQRIKDLSLKGGGIYHSQFLTCEPFRYRPKFRGGWGRSGTFYGGIYPCDSREIYFENVTDELSRRGKPSIPAERVMWLILGSGQYDPTDPQCARPHRCLEGPMDIMVPTPEPHMRDPDGMIEIRGEMGNYMRQALSQVVENVDSDNVVGQWAGTPYDSEFRNTGLLGGSWYGLRPCKDQWWSQRPLPELARYRTPIEGLYLCHQTSGHPGGLCLMAIPYNLMHILIEDGIAEPGDWWYPSPWYIPQQGKRSAKPR